MTDGLIVKEYIWDRGKPTANPGATVRKGKLFVFIEDEHLRTVADQISDLAEEKGY